jgi:hypothetical protein
MGGLTVATGVANGVANGVAEGASEGMAEGVGEAEPLQAANNNSAIGRLRRFIAATVLPVAGRG